MADDLLPVSLLLQKASDPEMQELVAARVDLQGTPAGRLRCGADLVAAARIVKPDPRRNATAKRKTAKTADKEARELWLSDPRRPKSWLHCWVSPAVLSVARQFEQRGAIDPAERGSQLVEGVGQRIADLRALTCVICSTWVANPRGGKAPMLVRHELLSELRTTPPPPGDAVVEFQHELGRLLTNDEVKAEVLAALDAKHAAERERAERRLERAARIAAANEQGAAA